MEYQTKKAQILANVQYTNLLQFSLVENKLERNFRTIVEALALNQAKTDSLNQDHISVRDKHSQQIAQLQNQMRQINQKGSQGQGKSQKGLSSKKIIQQSKSSQKQLELPQKQESSNENAALQNNRNENNNQANLWQTDKDKVLNDIAQLKDKLSMIGYYEGEIDSLKKDLSTLRLDLAANAGIGRNPTRQSLASVKNMKRESILSLKKVSDRSLHSGNGQRGTNNGLKSNGNMQGEQNNNESAESNKENQQQQSRRASSSSKHMISAQGRKSHSNINNANDDEDQSQSKPQPQLSIDQAQKQFNSVYIELNTLKLTLEEMKDMISDCKKTDYRHGSNLSELKEGLAKEIKDRIFDDQLLGKQIKQIQMDMLNVGAGRTGTETDDSNKAANNNSEASKNSPRENKERHNSYQPQNSHHSDNPNYANQINDKISRLQAMIATFITENEFDRFKTETRDALQKLHKADQQQDNQVEITSKALQSQLTLQAQQIQRLRNLAMQSNQQVVNNYNLTERKHNICLSKIEELKKGMQNLRQDMEFYQSMAEDNKKGAQNIEGANGAIDISEAHDDSNSGKMSDKDAEAMKRYFNGKMHDLRSNLIGMIRDVEKKLNNRSSVDHEIVKLWDKMNELNLFLGKKADQDDTKKSLLYLEKKINRLNAYVMKADDNTEDARIARTNQWHCLSCDKNLQTYQGKIGKHVVWDSMPLKGMNKTAMSNSANSGKDEGLKKSLPVLKR